MALIKCPECGREISTTAENCPHCGYKTARGHNVSEAKGLLVLYLLAVVSIVAGFILFFGNMEEFFDRVEYLDRFKYFSDEAKKAVTLFIFGVALLIGGVIDCICIKYQADKLGRGNYDGFSSGASSQGGTPDDGLIRTQNGRWECPDCGATNPPAAVSCTRCGANRRM